MKEGIIRNHKFAFWKILWFVFVQSREAGLEEPLRIEEELQRPAQKV